MKVLAFIVILLATLWFFRNVQEGNVDEPDKNDPDRIQNQINRLEEVKEKLGETQLTYPLSKFQEDEDFEKYHVTMRNVIKDNKDNIEVRRIDEDTNIVTAIKRLKTRKDIIEGKDE